MSKIINIMRVTWYDKLTHFETPESKAFSSITLTGEITKIETVIRYNSGDVRIINGNCLPKTAQKFIKSYSTHKEPDVVNFNSIIERWTQNGK